MLEESNESKVLIVGGDAAKLMAISQLLTQYNLSSSQARDAQEAIKLMKKRIKNSRALPMFSLIICDYSTQDFYGFQCMQEISAMLENNAQKLIKMPFMCCLTAYSAKKFSAETMREQGYLVVSKADFVEQLPSILEKSGLLA